jgi:hypothetical protein
MRATENPLLVPSGVSFYIMKPDSQPSRPDGDKPDEPPVTEFASSEEAQAHDRWVREKVARALEDTRPPIPHEQVVAEIDEILEAARKRSVPRT